MCGLVLWAGMAVALDSLALADSVAGVVVSDSVAQIAPLCHGIVLERPAGMDLRPLGETGPGISWLLTSLFAVFLIVALRYRKNSRFFSLMLHDVMEVRVRHNAFDDTLRETTFIWLLNVLWCGAAGVLFYGLLFGSEGTLALDARAMRRMGVCIGMAGAYTVFLTAAYSAVGSLFSDGAKATLWVKGHLSTQGLESLALFPIALLGLCGPGLVGPMVMAGCIVFVLAKLLFIYKGFCIFFTQIASWVLFLYYLCSLEIVPVILTYVSARYLCTLV